MSDPRNVAHDKKVKQEKAHHPDSKDDVKSRERHAPSAEVNQEAKTPPASAAEQGPGELEKSQAALSQLKDMEFHSRANIETLANLTLAIEEDLKQKEFSDLLGKVYAAQDNFHTEVTKLIHDYEAKVATLRSPA